MRRSTAQGNQDTHVQLITDPNEVALREAQNGLRQFDEVLRIVRDARAADWEFELTPDLIKRLQWFATEGVWSSAGTFRLHEVCISNTTHQPPHFDQVPFLVDEMCTYANRNSDHPIHVASYLMWRLNWIHPFGDGNGRTSRAVSYLALSVSIKAELPGTPTIPDLIVRPETKLRYYSALDDADAAWQQNQLSLVSMEALLKELLTQQLMSNS